LWQHEPVREGDVLDDLRQSRAYWQAALAAQQRG
jgi:hypothetical protein